jgi:hypothetical protein
MLSHARAAKPPPRTILAGGCGLKNDGWGVSDTLDTLGLLVLSLSLPVSLSLSLPSVSLSLLSVLLSVPEELDWGKS